MKKMIISFLLTALMYLTGSARQINKADFVQSNGTDTFKISNADVSANRKTEVSQINKPGVSQENNTDLSRRNNTDASGKPDADDLQNAVSRLDNAKSDKDFIELEKVFSTIALSEKPSWLAYYYAAYCNAKIGFIYQDDGERIEQYSNKGEEEVKNALALLDTATQKNELSEVYLVLSMVYRTKVFINPMTYGRKFGMLSDQYLKMSQRLNPENPRAIYLDAWVKYNTPKAWGGDKKLAKQLAEQSLAKLASSAPGVAPHWGKSENQELLGKYK